MWNNVYIPQESFMLYTFLCFLQGLLQHSASIITCTVQEHMSHLRQRSSTQFCWKQQLRTSVMTSRSTFCALHLPGHQWPKDMTITWIIEYYVMYSHPLFKIVLILPEWGQVLSHGEISAFDSISCQSCVTWPVLKLGRLLLVGFWLWIPCSRNKIWFNS
jgi:hypothetical protein